MKKLLLLIFLITTMIITGCGGNSNKGGNNGSNNGGNNGGNNIPPEGQKYLVKVIISTNTPTAKTSFDFFSSKAYAADELPNRTPDWFINRPANEYYSYANPRSDGGYFAPSSCWVNVYDKDGNLLTLTDEQKQNISWVCDYPNIEWIAGRTTGESVSFVIYDPYKIINFTATYKYTTETVSEEDGSITVTDNEATGTAKAIIATGAVVTLNGNHDELGKAGYVFSTLTPTDDPDITDIYYELVDGIYYINAPGGIAQIIGTENYSDGSTNWSMIPSVLKVPDNLTYSKKLPCVYFGTFIIKDRNGTGYTKVQSGLHPDPSYTGGLRTGIWFEHTDSSGIFNLVY